MSKSAGNFLTVEGAIETYTADGTRIALADAGDSLDDANFQTESANAALMRLYLLDQFVQEVLDKVKSRSFRTDSKNWIDNVFENEIVNLAEQARQSYEKLQYREALKSGFFDFGSLRDQYRNFCGSDGMHEQSIMRWIEVQTVILAPIAPHICEFIWSVRLEKPDILTSSGTSRWEAVLKLMPAFDALLHRKFLTLTGSLEEFRRVKEKSCAAEASAKKKTTEASTRPPLNAAVIYVAKEYLPWQQIVLKLLQTVPLTPDGRQPLDNHYVHLVRNDPEIKCMDKKTAKHVMPFACYRMKDELAARGAEALELQLPFNERALLEENRRILERLLGVVSLDIRWSTDAPHPEDRTDRINLALPSKPSIVFFSMENTALDQET